MKNVRIEIILIIEIILYITGRNFETDMSFAILEYFLIKIVRGRNGFTV